MIEKGENKEYLPIQGLDSFRKATVDLLLADSPAVKEVSFFMVTILLSHWLRLQAWQPDFKHPEHRNAWLPLQSCVHPRTVSIVQ
jgi:hypothetical protein